MGVLEVKDDAELEEHGFGRALPTANGAKLWEAPWYK